MPLTEQKITLQILLQSADAIRVTPSKDASVLESTVKPSRVCPFHSGLVADRNREILSLLARANAGARGLLPELVRAGQAFYVDLLPAFLKEKLQEASGRSLVLDLDRALLGIPWELLHDGEDFLGRRFHIGRKVFSLDQEDKMPRKRAMSVPLSALIVADPAGDLPAARREAEEVSEILENSPLFGQVTVLVGDVSVRAFRDELGHHDVLHYAGHAEAGGSGDGGGRLILKDGVLTTGMLAQLRGRVDFPGLVFLNGCSSSDDTVRLSAGGDPLSDVSSLASSLLLCGVRHVIGTLWDVHDDVARLCATHCYEQLAQGGTIGTALAASREAIIAAHGDDSLLWADHLLYGNPTWRAALPANAALDDFDVLDGLEQKYRRELLSTDAPTRLLAAAMLLRLGDRSVVPALARELETLLSWLAPDAPQREHRRAALVVQTLATAAGLEPSGPPDQLPDAAAVRALVVRLLRS
ncbi:MAG TPA: CHAT domain-containing protein [Planctomycetota bacterium]|nr:CHAT domain-containing protein [Planctomycetota bacterium]